MRASDFGDTPALTRNSRSSYSDDHFASGMSLFEIPNRLGRLAQTVAPVDHRLYLPTRHQIADQCQILFPELSQNRQKLSTRELRQRGGSECVSDRADHPRAGRPSRSDMPSIAVQDSSDRGRRMIADAVENDVVVLGAAREILERVVDDGVGA